MKRRQLFDAKESVNSAKKNKSLLFSSSPFSSAVRAREICFCDPFFLFSLAFDWRSDKHLKMRCCAVQCVLLGRHSFFCRTKGSYSRLGRWAHVHNTHPAYSFLPGQQRSPFDLEFGQPRNSAATITTERTQQISAILSFGLKLDWKILAALLFHLSISHFYSFVVVCWRGIFELMEYTRQVG